jgi:NDP-sugar pyrophosphorylase family protein
MSSPRSRLTLPAGLLLLAGSLAPWSAARAEEPAGPERPASGSDCRIEAGPRDRVAQDRTLVITAGEEVASAVTVRGDLVLERGARVEEAVAIVGNVVVRGGAVVEKDTVALGGDVRLEAGARVGKDAVALGGRVERGAKVEIGGRVLGLSLQLGESALGREILAELKAKGRCRVVEAGPGR